MLFRESSLKSRLPLAVAAIGCSLWTVDASAALVVDAPGDPTLVPFYQVHTYVGVNDHTTPAAGFEIQEGLITTTNLLPGQPRLFPQNEVNTLAVNGATITARTETAVGGLYLARNRTTLDITNANGEDGYYALSGYGSMTSVQFFTPEAAAARATFRWRVTGGETPALQPNCDPTTSTFDLCATARIDFAATNQTGVNYYDLLYSGNYGTMTEFGPGEYTYNIGGFALGDVITLGYWASAFVQINPGVLAQGENGFFAADYMSTYDLIGVDLFDADDNLLTNWTMTDVNTGATVFDQNGRIEPTAVPEPGSLALLGLGLLGVGVTSRRRLGRKTG